MKKTFFVYLSLFLSITAVAQQKERNVSGRKEKWTVSNVFSQKNFIQNIGQYNSLPIDIKENVLFGAEVDGLLYVFTPTGYTIIKNELDEIENGRQKVTLKKHVVHFNNTNSYAKIHASDNVEHYYSYSNLQNNTQQSQIANAYRKLIYENIYNKIDLVFEFPKDTSGIKYSFVLHPGANSSDIVMDFPSSTKINCSENELKIESELGEVKDFGARTYYQNSPDKIISCKFSKVENRIKFELGNYNSIDSTVIIDPFSITTYNFMPYMCTEIDYDSFGNVYAMGEAYLIGSKIAKLDVNGNLVWIYQAFIPIYTTNPIFYLEGGTGGDFAIDRSTNNIYIGEGTSNTAARVMKINSNAIQIGVFQGTGSMKMISRVSYSDCESRIILAGGSGPAPGGDQIASLDLNLNNYMHAQYVPSGICCHPSTMMELDKYGNVFQFTPHTSNSSVNHTYSNELIKLPASNLFPEYFHVPTNFGFYYLGYVNIMGNPGFNFTGYNGMAISNTNVYLTDSYTIRKFDGQTGNLLQQGYVDSPIPNTTNYWPLDVITGGITADDCGNVFITDTIQVKHFNENLSLIDSFPTIGRIADLLLTNNHELLICGEGFVTVLLPNNMITCNDTSTLGMNVSLTTNNAICETEGTASINVTNYNSSFDIVWNTSPFTYGDSVSNLQQGTYNVVITDSTCFHRVLYDSTFNILGDSSTFNSTISISNGCVLGPMNMGEITATIAGGEAPYLYSWSTGISSNSNSITNLSPGTYSLTITDNNGCINTYPSLQVSEPTAITYTVDGRINCYGDTTTMSILIEGGSPPYSVTWSNPMYSGTVLHGISAGSYSGVITDVGGCQQSFSINFSEPPPLSISSSSSLNCSVVNSGEIALSINGGSVPYSYDWQNSALPDTNVVSNLSPGVYSVVVTDLYGCVVSIQDTIENYSAVSVNSPIICQGESVVLQATGGTSYSWSAGATPISLSQANVSPNSTTTYTLTALGTISSTCPDTAVSTVTVKPRPNISVNSPTICAGQTANLTGTGASFFIWPSGVNSTGWTTANANPLTTTTYMIVGAFNGCFDTAYFTVSVDTVIPSIIVSTDSICYGEQANVSAIGADTYTWSAGLTPVGFGLAVVSPASTSTYTVSGAIGACSSQAVFAVIVNSIPIVSFNNLPLNTCIGYAPINLSGNPIGGIFSGPGVIGNVFNQGIAGIGEALISYVYTDTNNCTANVIDTIYVLPSPTIQLSGNDTICSGATTILTAIGNGSISWSTGDTNNMVALTLDSTMIIEAYSTNQCGVDSSFMTIQVIPLPMLNQMGDHVINSGDSVQLSYIGTADSIFWSPSNGLSCTNCPNPIASPSQTTSYTVTIYNEFGCVNSGVVTVYVENIGNVFIPDIFSPNGDGQNDVLYVRGKGLKEFNFVIYDRWGEKIFETSDQSIGWDGTYKGTNLNNAVFVYYFKGINQENESIVLKGDITLYR
ncbi:MAG: gliding motility-associated C-terminal domain-containing protein [Bacteroidetes bacterium]|nr:gliding motility-associated C-terminal domain-containing protein [Bacteroidota bacterium]